MERVLRFTFTGEGDEIGTATFDHPALAARCFEALSKEFLKWGIGIELEDKGKVLSASYYDPQEVNG